MQDANVRGWTRESQVSPEMLRSVRVLNLQFLELAGKLPVHWSATRRPRLRMEVSGQIEPLSGPQKEAAANCPYALFDLRFQDDAYWRARLASVGPGTVADEIAMDESTLDFVRLALFFAWHVASTAALAAPLLLGMQQATAAVFRTMPIDCMPHLVGTEAVNLTARWNDCPSYWNALTGAALRPNPLQLRRIQLCGLQLAAAARLA